jgi:hypothetical protein
MARWLERGVGAAAGAILTLSVPATAEVATSGPILPSERDMMQMPRTVAASDYRDS